MDFGISIGPEGLRGFYLSGSNYYRVPEGEVVIVRERGIPYDEIPVVFFVANRARIAPGVIMELRLGGKCAGGTFRCVTASAPKFYYVPTTAAVKGPPYGKAYGHYKKHPRNR